MYRYALLDAAGRPIQIVRAADAGDAALYGLRNVHGYKSVVDEQALRERHEAVVESFRERYFAEGRSAEQAKTMAEAAAGPLPAPRVATVAEVPAQDTLPRASERRSRATQAKAGKLAAAGSGAGLHRVEGSATRGVAGGKVAR